MNRRTNRQTNKHTYSSQYFAPLLEAKYIFANCLQYFDAVEWAEGMASGL